MKKISLRHCETLNTDGNKDCPPKQSRSHLPKNDFYKSFIFSLAIIASFTAPAFAEKIPIKLTSTELLSTKYDEIEVGDLIDFQTLQDVYINDKLYIKQGTKVVGVVDFLHNNGWGGDNAEIKIEKFVLKNIDGKKITINYPIRINGNSETANGFKQVILANIFILIRGSEIYIEPSKINFNIFIEQ